MNVSKTVEKILTGLKSVGGIEAAIKTLPELLEDCRQWVET